jgi:hypothetical protein
LGGSGRLRVQVGAFKETYDLGGCSSWCLLDHNVTEELRPGLTLAQYASILHSDRAVSVTISLELFNAGSYFVAFLDDIQVDASVPLGSRGSFSQSSQSGGISNQDGTMTSVNSTAEISAGLARSTRVVFQYLSISHCKYS